MSYIVKIVVSISIAIVTVSCSDSPSLQEYYVDSQASANFISVDIPSSILSLKNENVGDDVKTTLNSVRKINFLGFQKSDANSAECIKEQLKIKEILKSSEYNELIRFEGEKKSMQVKFLGEDDAIDEVIFYGADSELGFALIRILGNKMDPSKMLALANEINVNDQSNSFKQITSFISTIK